MKSILAVLPALTEEEKAEFKNTFPQCKVVFKAVNELTQEIVDSAQIIVGNIPNKFLHEQKIEFIQLTSAGADDYVKPGILDRSTILACCSGAYNRTVAEHAFATTLALQKNLFLYRDNQNQRCWADEGMVTSIEGSTVLVVGLGEIGKAYAKMAKALGAYVIGIKRRPGNKPEYVDEQYTAEQFETVVGRADVIFSILPGTQATKHFYTIDRFKLMKNKAIFINCGRGSAVATDVLYEALSNKMIRCAGIDVTEQEPLPSDSKLWSLKNLLITPHASGHYHLAETKGMVMDICENNLKAYLSGGEVKNIVDYETGYKKTSKESKLKQN